MKQMTELGFVRCAGDEDDDNDGDFLDPDDGDEE